MQSHAGHEKRLSCGCGVSREPCELHVVLTLVSVPKGLWSFHQACRWVRLIQKATPSPFTFRDGQGGYPRWNKQQKQSRGSRKAMGTGRMSRKQRTWLNISVYSRKEQAKHGYIVEYKEIGRILSYVLGLSGRIGVCTQSIGNTGTGM